MSIAPRQLPLALAAHSNPRVAEAVCTYLQAHGWRVHRASNGADALRVLRGQAVRLAILDIDLPGMDALAVVTAARASGRRFHSLFLDSLDRPDVRTRCLTLGALGYLARPPSPASLTPFLQQAAALSLAPEVGEPEDDPPFPPELKAGSRVVLTIRVGASAGQYPALVVETSPASMLISASDPRGGSPYVSLGTGVCIGFETSGEWGEFESRVVGSSVRPSGIEMLLAPPQRVLRIERRKHPRVALSLPVRIWPASPRNGAQQPLVAQTEDIGPRGLRLLCQAAPGPDSQVFLAIQPNDGTKELVFAALRVWQTPDPQAEQHRCGFLFRRSTRDAKRRLRALLAAAADDSGGAQPPSPEQESEPLIPRCPRESG